MDFKPHQVEWDRKKAARFWDHLPPQKTEATYFSQQVGESIVQLLLKLGVFKHKENSRVLDYGCGQGYLSQHFDQKNIACDGADFSESAIRIAENMNKHLSQIPHFYHLDQQGQHPDLESETYTHLLSLETVEHLLDHELAATFQQWHRLIQNQGYLILSTPNAEDLSKSQHLCPDCGCIFHQWQHIHSWKAQSLTNYAESHGFETVTCLSLNLRPASKLNFLKNGLDRLLKRPNLNLIYVGKKKL